MADPIPMADLESLLAERRLDREDYQTQIEAAARSIECGHYACAKAELRGALIILDMMEQRDGRYQNRRRRMNGRNDVCGLD